MITRIEISIILLRVLAIYMLLQALAILPMSFRIVAATPVAFFMSHEFSSFVIATILWFAAPFVSKIMCKGFEGESTLYGNTSYSQIEPIIFSAIGIILISVSIPSLADMYAYNIAMTTSKLDSLAKAQMNASFWGFTTEYIAQIVLGIFLLVCSHTLCSIVGKVRMKIKDHITIGSSSTPKT